MSIDQHPSAPTAAQSRVDTRPPLDLEGLLDGARILVMGGTGFLGKVWFSMLLHQFPQVGHCYLVVRARTDKNGRVRQTSEQRFWAEVATSPTFDPLRERYPGAAFEAFLRQKVTPIPGDITEELCGVPAELRDALRGTLDVLVNSSGVVDFNPPLDYALNVNAFGMKNLVALCRDLGRLGTTGLPLFHTSTCYVAGDRTGAVDEVNPLSFPFPKAADLDRKHWDPEREISECLDLVDNVRHRANDAFRESAFLDQAKKNLFDRNEPRRGSALADELKKVRREFEEQRLVAGGNERAKFWGWHNIYTYTKSIGEQILCLSGLRFTIGRPAVIESSLEYPRVGWNEGINTSAPLIYMAVQGPVRYPQQKETVLDVIPVDMVASGMMVSLGELLEGTHRDVYQYGSSDSAPLPINRLIELVGLWKRSHFRNKSTGSPLMNALAAHWEPTAISVSDYFATGPAHRAEQVGEVSTWLKRLTDTPLRDVVSPLTSALDGLKKSLTVQARITDQFVPFMATHNYRFSCANTRAAWARLPEAQRGVMSWTPEKIDWRAYLYEVHCPGIHAHVSPLIEERLSKPKKPLKAYDHLIALLDEVAERHDEAPALLRTHEDGFTRISYKSMRARAESVAVRLAAAGVQPGDRVIISGANHPSWPIACFGIFRAGAVAVPLDPGLDLVKARAICANAQPALALLDAKAEAAYGAALVVNGAPVKILDIHAASAPGAVGKLPVVELTSDSLASVLYTSGTTGDPKGVMLTHGNFCAMTASIGRLFPLNDADRLLSVLPMHHAFEFSCGLLLPLSMGARIIYLDEINGDRLSYGLQEGKVTAMVGVPALWQLLERRIRNQVRQKGQVFGMAFDGALNMNRAVAASVGIDLGRLLFGSVHSRFGGHVRMLISGGAALPKDTQRLFSGLGLHMSEGYGLTEAAPVLTASAPKPGMKAGNVGQAIPGVEVRINEPNEAGVGEVWARGANVMKGYFGNVVATEAVLTKDGWLRTGDMGKLDHKGRLSLVGRAKEVVVTATGENVYLDDVEAALGTLRHVKEYVLVGIPDPRGGERLGMLAVPDGEEKLDRITLHERAQTTIREAIEGLPTVQRPAVVHLVDADLPRTATRKIQRKESAAVLLKIVEASAAKKGKGGGIGGPVMHAVAAVAGVDESAITSASRLREDFGFDSLMYVELASALEGVGQGRPDADSLSRVESVADIVALVGAPPVEPRTPKDPTENTPYYVPSAISEAAKEGMRIVQAQFNGPGLGTKVYGRANIPQNRQTIVVSNHTSHLDMGLVKYALGDYGNRVTALAAKDYFFEGNRAKITWFTHFTNVEPLDRKTGFRASMREARAVIDEGRVVLLFPEGTRQTDGTLGEFKPLVGKLSLDTGVDILPLYIDGAHKAMPKGRMMPTRRGIKVRVGLPLPAVELRRLTAGLKASDAARKATELLRMAVEKLGRGELLDISTLKPEDINVAVKLSPEAQVERIFTGLPPRFTAEHFSEDRVWYFTLGGSDGPRATLRVTAAGATWHKGKPEGGADCVVKTSVEMFRKICEEGYAPDPSEFISGAIKVSEIPLLIEFSQLFNLSEPRA